MVTPPSDEQAPAKPKAAQPKRVYLLLINNKTYRLVRAISQAEAIVHAVKGDVVQITVATPEDLAEAEKLGLVVEDPGKAN